MKVTAFFCHCGERVESADFIKRRIKKYRIIRERLLLESVDTAIRLFFFLYPFLFFFFFFFYTYIVLDNIRIVHVPRNALTVFIQLLFVALLSNSSID